nr:adenylate/guanylate cyclase domain-containing protein [Micromonospora sp. DSM 115978]
MSAPCVKCGRTAATDDRFCGGCGTELTPACLNCGRPLATAVAFCTACGTPRPDGRVRAATGSHEDRRRVSVLFIDLIDFTPYVERADPELVRAMQTGFFSAARRVVGQYGGVVEKYIGDAVMALFGAPVATETDALRCVRAGLELQRVLARFAPTGADGLRFRVGLATGEALVDVAAARDGGQAIVAGDVVNTAARMQSVAPPGGVLVCGTTYQLTRDTIEYEQHAPVVLRGRSASTEVWLAVAPMSPRSPEREVDTAPMIDREHELGLLVNALHRSTRDRVPQVVTVLGRAGIGKSRLVRELSRRTDEVVDRPLTWRIGRCPPFGENVAFAALADIVKAEAGILDTDPAATAATRLTAAVGELFGLGRADRITDALRPLVGLPGANLPAEETESAWRRFLLTLAARRPTVLVFEDLHWADEAMLRFIELLGAAARDVPLLLLCTARPELVTRDPSWAGTINGSLTITLPPLRDSGIAALYAHMFGPAAFPTAMLGPLVEVADGNPLYAHEYVRMLIEQGSLRQSGQGWSLEQRGDLPMPDSVHSVIANRVDLLDPDDRSVLLAASVVGMQFWPGAVAAALGAPVESVERALRRLEQRDLVHEQSSSTMAGQPEFRFRHVLVRDVCYQRLPRTERVARHERTASWLDALSGSRDTDLAEVLAHHRWAAHEIARTLGLDTEPYAPPARQALLRAARRAYALHALESAAGHIGRALTLFPDGAAPDSQERLRLELFSAEIAFYRDHDTFLSHGGTELLTKLAEQLHDRAERGQAARAWTLLGQAAWLRADQPTALAHLDRAVGLFADQPDSPEKADAYAELGRLYMLNFEDAPAIDAAEVAADIAGRLGLVEVRANAQITIGIARYQSGDRAGLDELETVLELCRTQRLLAVRRALRNLAAAVLEEGDWVRSNALLAEANDDVQGGHNLDTGVSRDLMIAYYTGDFDTLLAAADGFVASSAGRWDLQVRGLRAALRVLRGEPVPGPSDTDDDIADSLAMARGSGFHRMHWTALGMGALVRALQGRRAEAADLLAELARAQRAVPALFSGEWSAAVACAAALCDRPTAGLVHDMLDRPGHLTAWGQAALHTVAAAIADAEGAPAKAADGHLAAAEVYARIPDRTDRMFSMALAVGALRRAGDQARADRIFAEVREFALHNRAPGLLKLAEHVPHRPGPDS